MSEELVLEDREISLKDKMKKEITTIRGLTLIISFTGLVFLATSIFFIAIPTSEGFFNIGEVFVYLAALIGGPVTGSIAGGLGASMADLALGYGYFAPGTFIIKAIEGFVVGLLYHYSLRIKKWIKILFIGIMCAFLIGFSSFLFNSDYEIGLALYNGTVFSSIIPGYSFLIISLVLSAILISVIVFLKEKGEMAISCVTGGAFIVVGYFFYETVILSQTFSKAVVEIPFNIAQVIFGAAIAIPIVSYLIELGVLKSTSKPETEKKDKLIEDSEEKLK
ncbi:MAG: ECF transporter S component [Candidatus Heimdallarchaeota archaeon]|nr:ECF transporter S component [Candidatus Heimdallarchaeota archaeon]